MLQVSVEFGLCEMLNKRAIRAENAPKDGNFAFNISDCEAVLPQGTVDSSVERVYKELPKWEESIEGARDRYKNIIKILADKYPTENLLLVTHGEGVGVSVTANTPEDVIVIEVEYCAYSPLMRTISKNEDGSLTFGEFKVSRDHGHTGISTTRMLLRIPFWVVLQNKIYTCFWLVKFSEIANSVLKKW